MSDIYFKCLCGKSLAVDAKGAGRTIACPDCKQKLQIPESASQLQCECGTSILVPESMAGDTVQCLSCKKYLQVPGKQEDVLRDHEPPEKGSVQINLKLGASFFVKALIALVIIVAISVFFSVKRHKKPTLSASLIGGSSEQAGAATNKQAVGPQTQAEVVVSNKTSSNAINNQTAESQIKAVSDIPDKSIVPAINRQEVSQQNIKPVASSKLLEKSGVLTFSSMESGFNNRGEFKGAFTIASNAINIVIDDAVIFSGSGNIDSFRICLGKATANNSWMKVRGSEPWKCNLVIKPGERFHLKNLTFTIPLDDSIDLNQHWFVVEILSITQDGRNGYCYAISRKDIFSRLSENVEISTPVVANASQSPLSLSELRKNGAFAFPQQDAKVLCDQPDLRFSVWNNDKYLFAQAVLWNSGDASLGKTKDNREIGDWAQIILDLDADGKVTPKVDRSYALNPRQNMPGLYYTICMGERSTTGLQRDSKGRGAINYVETSERKKVRVDTYLIPMAEISRHVGEKIQICYWGYSPEPLPTVNSVGYENASKTYPAYNIPRSQYHEYDLVKGGEIDAAKVPEGRNTILTVENDKPITSIATPVAPAAVKSVTYEQLVAAQSTGESKGRSTNKVESMQVTTTSNLSLTQNWKSNLPSTSNIKVDLNGYDLSALKYNGMAVSDMLSEYSFYNHLLPTGAATKVISTGLRYYTAVQDKENILRPDILLMHPSCQGTPSVLDLSNITKGEKGVLVVSFLNMPGGNCDANIIVDGKDFQYVTVKGDVWKDYSIPFNNKPVKIENHNTGWEREFLFVSFVIKSEDGIISGAKKDIKSVHKEEIKSMQPPGTNNLLLAANWNVGMKSSEKYKTDLTKILRQFGEAKVDLNRNNGIIIFKDLTYLMDVKEAFNKLDERVSSFTQLNTPYFANRSFKCFVISKIITDGGRTFNRIILVTDTQNQLIAVQLVNENPENSCLYERDQDYSVYNIIQNKTKGSSAAHVNYNTYFVGDQSRGHGYGSGSDYKSDVLCIESELSVKGDNRYNSRESREFVRLYLPIPIVNLVLYCLQTSK